MEDAHRPSRNIFDRLGRSKGKDTRMHLEATTKKWIRQVEPETVITIMLMRQFQGARKYATPLSRLASIKQVPGEMLKAYIKHFKDELTTIHDSQENGVMMAAISVVRIDTSFWDKL